MQNSPMFKNIGRIATDMYLLFQHHTTVEMMRNVSTDHDIFTITGNGWHFVKFFGPAVAVVGPDCRFREEPSPRDGRANLPRYLSQGCNAAA